MGRDFLANSKIVRLSNAVAAGSSDEECTGVDMSGWTNATFIACLGTIVSGGVQSMKLQGSSDNAAADAYADITGAVSGAVADTDDNKIVALEISNPSEVWVRPVVERATQNCTIDSVIVILTGYKGTPAEVATPTSISKAVRS